MRTLRQRLTSSPVANERLVLPFELRQRSRLRTRLESGSEVGLFLERGLVLRGGDLLLADDGAVVEVVAALETVSTVRELDPMRLARAGYHLGNRHVPVEIGPGWLRYGHDHVLDDMVRGLGLPVVVEQAPFEPEAGAYGHSHAHDDAHDHPPAHEHAHEHAAGDGHSHEPAPETPAAVAAPAVSFEDGEATLEVTQEHLAIIEEESLAVALDTSEFEFQVAAESAPAATEQPAAPALVEPAKSAVAENSIAADADTIVSPVLAVSEKQEHTIEFTPDLTGEHTFELALEATPSAQNDPGGEARPPGKHAAH